MEREKLFSHSYQSLDGDQVLNALVALAEHFGLTIVRVTDEQWPEGHPDRIRFEIKKEGE
jgi:hypothetical protein